VFGDKGREKKGGGGRKGKDGLVIATTPSFPNARTTMYSIPTIPSSGKGEKGGEKEAHMRNDNAIGYLDITAEFGRPHTSSTLFMKNGGDGLIVLFTQVQWSYVSPRGKKEGEMGRHGFRSRADWNRLNGGKGGSESFLSLYCRRSKGERKGGEGKKGGGFQWRLRNAFRKRRWEKLRALL